LITYEFDPNTLAKVERKLGSLKSEAPKALKNAINQTAKAARKDLAEEAQKTYVVKSGRFNKAMTIKNATQGNLEATIKATGAPMELKDFKVSPATARTGSKRPSITKAKVLASGSLKGLDFKQHTEDDRERKAGVRHCRTDHTTEPAGEHR